MKGWNVSDIQLEDVFNENISIIIPGQISVNKLYKLIGKHYKFFKELLRCYPSLTVLQMKLMILAVMVTRRHLSRRHLSSAQRTID